MRPERLPAAAGAAVVVARLFPLAPLRDAATGLPAPDAALAVCWGHLALTPFAVMADLLTCNSLRQHGTFLIYLFVGYALTRLTSAQREPALPLAGRVRKELGAFAAVAAAFVVFLIWTVLWPRAASRLELSDPDLLAVDFHSHTSYSWDGRKGFSPARNALWHRRTGYGAGFVTDHNRTDGAAEAKDLSRQDWSRRRRDYASLEGEELSLYNAHVVVLGNSRHIDPELYAGGLDGVRRLLKDSRAVHGGLAVMSLPEYWKHDWDQGLERFADWGAKGFEIATASPRALDFPRDKRRRVVELCRRRGLFLAGASDNHGYGSAACVWNVLKVPGWHDMGPDSRQKAVMDALRRDGFSAVRVLARTRQEPAPGAAIALDPPLALWTLLRTLTWAQSLAALGWLALSALALRLSGL